MPAPWWDELHRALWRVCSQAELERIAETARRVARQAEQLIGGETSSAHEWTPAKATLLKALDEAGLNSLVTRASGPIATRIALAVWELAWVDGGAAACCFSGSLPQAIIREHGTSAQRERYLERPERCHGALCVTEPIPGAGAEALLLSGKIKVAGRGPDGAPMLEVEKRGRFTSHMDFADFVLAAVAPADRTVGRGCLVILEPSDPGLFDRGAPMRKLGRQLSSTTSPSFRLGVSAERILGGYTMEDGVTVPRFGHGEVLSSALRRARSIAGVMSASNLLSAVETVIEYHRGGGGAAEWAHRLVDIWAAGEAAAALGFAATRLLDELDAAGSPASALETRAGVICPCAKLFATAHAAPLLHDAVCLIGTPALIEDGPHFLGCKFVDAMVGSLYLGPESVQRRQISAAVDSEDFLSLFGEWTEEAKRAAATHPQSGAGALAAGMDLWRFAFGRLRGLEDSRGIPVYADVHQGVTFAVADALCLLVAARAFLLDVLEMGNRLSAGAFVADLSAVQSARTASAVGRICAQLVFGLSPGIPVSADDGRRFADLRSRLDASLCGIAEARERAAGFIRTLASA